MPWKLPVQPEYSRSMGRNSEYYGDGDSKSFTKVEDTYEGLAVKIRMCGACTMVVGTRVVGTRVVGTQLRALERKK